MSEGSSSCLPLAWSRRWAPSGPVLLSPPVGRAVYHATGRDLVVDGPRVWELAADVARAWPVAEVAQVVPDREGVRLETPTVVLRLGPTGAARSSWEDGFQVRGVRVVVVDGLVVVGDRALDVVDREERCSVGPRGELAVVGPRGLRLAPRGRTPVDVGLEIDPESLRWAPDGRSVTVRAERGEVRVEVATLAVRPTRARPWIPEASCAISGTFVAGPAGRVWDLRDGSALAGASVALGATVAAGPGFVTVDWETGRGAWIDLRGGPGARFRLPLDEEDLVVGGATDGAGALLWSAEGRCFRVAGATVEEVDAEEEPPEAYPTLVESPAGLLLADAELALDGRRWAWSGSGGLLGWPSTN